MEVTVVNDRPEKYIRAQTVLYDYKWMNQLSWFLGTAFDKLFDEDNGVGRIHKDLYKLQVLAFQEVQFPTKEDPQFKGILKPSRNGSNCPTSVVFDVLASVAGAADSIRDTYIGLPREYTIPKRFAIAALEKGSNLKKHKLLPPGFAKYTESYKEVKQLLESQGIDKMDILIEQKIIFYLN
uniref:Uncharacterized protein n=1 Tax=Ditylenchus dipsaci TaxID=166011 RepID=A0A915ECD5_9BILA